MVSVGSLECSARDPVKLAAGRVCGLFAERKQRRLGEVRRSRAFRRRVSFSLHLSSLLRALSDSQPVFVAVSQALAVLSSVVNPLVEGGLVFAGSPCGSCLSCVF